MSIESIATANTYAVPRETSIGVVQPQEAGGSFAEALGAVIHEANRDQVDATQKAVALTVKGEGTIHDAMVAADKAEGSFRLLMEMRNRIVEGVNRLLETQL